MVRGLQQHLSGIDTKVTERRSAIEQEKAAVAKAAEEERQAQAAEEQRQAEAAEVKRQEEAARKKGATPPAPSRPAPRAPAAPAAPADPGGCVIKGNINSSGERIYHVPGGQFYDVTEITSSKGERMFCSAAEAVAAGWRASQR